MIVAQLSLVDFRNYATLEIGLVPGPNVFVGANGQGKTNLVEAIAYLSTLGSHRVSTDQALIRSGADAAIVRARLEHADRDVLLEARSELIHDVTGVFEAWQRGTVVRSWLLELLVKALEEDPELEDIEGYVEDSGEGRWTVIDALDHAVPVPTISASIFARFVSRQKDSPAMKAVAALRKQFGGHAVRKA